VEQLGKKPHKSFPDDADKKKIKAQAQQLKYYEKEIKRLKAELATVNAAFKKSAEYMADESGPISVEKLIQDAKNHKPLRESKKDAEKQPTKEETRAKWARWIEEQNKAKEDEE
jgi:DNA-binding ferritin-like protein